MNKHYEFTLAFPDENVSDFAFKPERDRSQQVVIKLKAKDEKAAKEKLDKMIKGVFVYSMLEYEYNSKNYDESGNEIRVFNPV